MSTPEEKAFEKETLDAHNKFRAQHGCPPLKINKTLTKQAKEWAQHLIDHNILQHNPNSEYGENLFMSQGMANVNGEIPVKAWYDEIKEYSFSAAKFSPATGHFTQVIWKDTKDVGIAIAKKDVTVVVVANYNPPGNFVGKFKENVPPKLRTPPPEEAAATSHQNAERGRPSVEKKTPKNGNAAASSRASSSPVPWAYTRVSEMFSGPRPKQNTSTNPNTDRKSFELEVLEAINKIRVSHGMPPLKINKRLSQQAQNWVQILADNNIHRNNQDVKVRQNIYKTKEPNVSGAKPVEEWYKELDKNGFQVILNGTKELGVGFLKKGDTTLVVSIYNSPESKENGKKDERKGKKDDQKGSPKKDEQKGGTVSKICPCLR